VQQDNNAFSGRPPTGAPAEPDKAVLDDLLARFVARQNERLAAKNKRADTAAKATKKTPP
jgi:hypothetical protein